MRRFDSATLLFLVACSGGEIDVGGPCQWTCPTLPVTAVCVGDPVLDTGASGCDVGDALPGVFLADCCGRLTSMAELVCRHRALVIELGAGWCQECREQAPTQVAWHSEYAGQGLGVVTVLKETDTAGAPANREFCACWGEDYAVPYSLLIDPADELTTRCAPALPTTLVVDANGRIVSKVVGGDVAEIEASFQEVLEGSRR